MATIYGYCRISTRQQSIERQERNIKSAYPDAVLVSEAFTGTRMDRPRWEQLMKKVKAGDTIVFDSVSRMSRDATNGIEVYMELYNKSVDLVFLKEHHIDTQTYRKALKQAVPMTGTAVDCILEGVNQYLITLAKEQIQIAFDQSEKEVQDLRQRTREGMETARMMGHVPGSPKGTKLHTKKGDHVKEVILKYSKDFKGSLNDVDCMKLAGVARNTYYKYKADLKRLEN